MASGESPLDPLFYLHHCNLDRLWAIWQLNNPDDIQYEHTGILASDSVPQARVPIDSMMVEGASMAEGVTPRSVLDHVALGYVYQRDVALEDAWFEKHGTRLITHVESASNVGIWLEPVLNIMMGSDLRTESQWLEPVLNIMMK